MNDFYSIQNDSEMIQLQAAQRELYSQVKKYLGYSFTFGVLIPTIASVLYLLLSFFPDFTLPWLKTAITVYGFIMLFINTFLLDKVGSLKKVAARVQEEFDTRLYGMEWNEILAGRHPEPHEWLEPASLHLHQYGNNRLTDWYLNDPIRLPSSIMMLLCQSKNLSWDARLKRKISNLLSLIIGVNGIILLVLAIAINPPAANIFSLIALLAPVVHFCYRYIRDNKKSIANADELRQKIESELNTIAETGEVNDTHLKKTGRNIQDQIFSYRVSGNPVPDWIHRRNRHRDEDRYDRIFNYYAKKLRSRVSLQ